MRPRATIVRAPATSLETTICGDIILADLDSAVATAYAKTLSASDEAQAAAVKQAQRDWAAARYGACDLPRKKVRWLTTQQLWVAAPCLATLYRTRLAELGGTEGPVNGWPRAYEEVAGFIHPHCFVPGGWKHLSR